jgi:hypothetical protein
MIESTNPYSSQNTPARFYGLIIIKDLQDFYAYRDSAYGLIVQSITNKGKQPAGYDIRPVSPIDDFNTVSNVPGGVNNYNGDWSISSAVITDTGASFSGVGNTALAGQMPQSRWLTIFGTELLSAAPGAEVAWRFKNGANTKALWMIQDLWGWNSSGSAGFPKAAAQIIPVWNPSEPVYHIVYATAARTIYDVHYSLWAEPTGTTITGNLVRA